MFGSALTLASFVKVLHGLFLGSPYQGADAPVDTGGRIGWTMNLPMILLAAICLGNGVLAFRFPVPYLVSPAVGENPVYLGTWQPGLAAILLVVGLLAGILVYLATTGKAREDAPYVGGETGPKAAAFRFAGTEFYRTVQEMPGLRTAYRAAEAGLSDVYELGQRIVFYASESLGTAHSGVLPRYVTWVLAGLLVIGAVLGRR
jgi:NADH:ubiquinone oxidoreductase subunit 5 (subunit L)/multisubunit Na+/H+ antiporter MnhA subunit